MDVTQIIAALQTFIQQANDEKNAKQTDIDAKNLQITDLKTAIKDAQNVQGMDDTIIAAAQQFIDELTPWLPQPLK